MFENIVILFQAKFIRAILSYQINSPAIVPAHIPESLLPFFLPLSFQVLSFSLPKEDHPFPDLHHFHLLLLRALHR